MLGARPGDSDRIAFLEGVRADQVGRHLAGDDDKRDGVHQGVDDAGHRVGGAGAGGHQHDAALAGGARVPLGGMGRALFMTHQHMLQPGFGEQGVIDRQHGAAGIAEQHLDALVDERAHDHLGARERGGFSFNRLVGGHGTGSRLEALKKPRGGAEASDHWRN